MDYKYIKYKNKYMILKNQYGNGYLDYRAPACNKKNTKIIKCDNIKFYNRIGTCWMISIFIIFLSSDSTSKCVQSKLNNMDINDIFGDHISYKLLTDFLPTSLLDESKIINLLYYMKERFNIKLDDLIQPSNIPPSSNIAPPLTRQKSKENEQHFAEIIYSLFNKTPILNERGIYIYGTTKVDIFFIINILSSLLLQKLITFNTFYINTRIDLTLLKKSIGIIIDILDHACAFYICENQLKFCNNDKIINYNWIKLFNICNTLTESKTKYNIYLKYRSVRVERGPFIYVNNKMIYFDNKKKTEELNTDNIQFTNNKDYLNIISFTFLTYDNMISTFKKRNSIYYSNYYILLNKFNEYKIFINKNNITGIDLNQIYTGLYNPLYIACKKGYNDIVALLLSKPGINVNYINNNGISPLYIACNNGYINIVTLLLKYPNININQPTNDGVSSLYIACQNKYLDIIALLLDNTNIDINQPTNNNISPLFMTCEKGYHEIVNLLSSHSSIDINHQTNSGSTPLFIACYNKHTTVVTLLLRHPDINITLSRNDDIFPLYIACQNGHLDIVTLLFNNPKTNINQRSNVGITSLFIACQYGHLDIVTLLLQHPNININDATNNRATPLFIACHKGHIKIVNLLIGKPDIGINDATINGLTPLYIACNNGNIDIVNLLLTHPNIDITQPANNGSTPLNIAYNNEHIEIVNILKSRLCL